MKKGHYWKAPEALYHISEAHIGGAVLEQTPSPYELKEFEAHFPRGLDETNATTPYVSPLHVTFHANWTHLPYFIVQID